MVNQKYPHLFKPLKIKNVELKNRIVKSSQWFIYVEPDGSVGERLKCWYESLAKGGVGLITVEESVPDYPLGASNVPHMRLDEDRFIPGLTELADIIHKYDCPAFVQITHAGPAHNPQVANLQPVAPSSMDPPARPHFSVARELSIAEIKDIIEKFAQAALRVKKAGFDGVEVHMAHYALGNAFLSRVQNKRRDDYGCDSLENRARFATEVIKRTRELVGQNFVVGVRMCAKEWGHELGTTNDEAVEFARMFEQASADYLQVSAYGYGIYSGMALPDVVLYPDIQPETKIIADRMSTGALIPEANVIKKAVSIPISGIGRLDYKIGEEILEKGLVDMVCFGRRFMADPEFPKKVMENRESDIRPCLGCCNCYHMYLMNQPIQCRVNAFAGNEKDMMISPAAQQKKVMVVGAGPAGMETARVAAERGHDVSLYDKQTKLGGLLPMASLVKSKINEDLPALIKYYRVQLKKLGVKLCLGTEVDYELINNAKPDVVILATGGKMVANAIPVEKGAHALSSGQLKNLSQRVLNIFGSRLIDTLTKIILPIGKNITVVGGDLAGFEVAEFLAKRGKIVTIVEESEQLGEGMLIPWYQKIIPWFESRSVTMLTNVKCKKITRQGLITVSGGAKQAVISADTVILIEKHQNNHELYNRLVAENINVKIIGDARSDQLGYIKGAIHDGAEAGLAV